MAIFLCFQETVSPLPEDKEQDLRKLTIEEKWKIVFSQVQCMECCHLLMVTTLEIISFRHWNIISKIQTEAK